MNSENALSILLVDDDDVACESIVRSFKKNDISFPIVIAHDGAEALEILRGEHFEKDITGNKVILLDLNMPRMNGFEFLEEMRSDSKLSSNVVFVLTTSNDDNDRARAYDNFIAGYMVKSVIGPQFSKLANLLTNYDESIKLPA